MRMNWHSDGSSPSSEERGDTPEALAAMLRAVAHPIRIRVLLEMTDESVSPVALHRTLGEPRLTLGALAYHVRGLARAGLIVLTGLTPRRGAVEHSYSLTERGRAVVAALKRL